MERQVWNAIAVQDRAKSPVDSRTKTAPFNVTPALAAGRHSARLSRLTDCHTRTVLSVLETVGEKLAQLLDARIRNIEVAWGLQLDELHSRVGFLHAFS